MSANPDHAQEERPRRPRADGVLMHERALWSYSHIALYSGFQYNYIANELAQRADFPKPIRASEGGQPRYLAGEVMAYFEARRDP